MLNSSLLATSLCIFMLAVVLLPQYCVGVDLDIGIAWTNALQDNLAALEEQELMGDSVINIINTFDSLNPPERQTNPDTKWVDSIAQELNSLMESRASVAMRLAAEVERLYILNANNNNDNVKIYDSLDHSTWDATFRSTLTHHESYSTNVSFEYSTVRYPDYAKIQQDNPSSSAGWSGALDSFFKDAHANDNTLESLYFASSSGYLRAFPGGPWTIKPPPNSPGSASYDINGFMFKGDDGESDVRIAGYNARFRPWYVLGASGPKDVVLVLDASTSMGSMYEVRKAAVNVVSGLSAQDYVNVVVFNTKADVSTCWHRSLVRATDGNKQMIKSFLMNLDSATGKTNIEAGVEMGLKLLDSSAALNRTSHCSQILLLLTDGVTSATHFTISNKQDARLFAYVLNTYTDTSPLQRLTCANNGILIPVPNPASAYVEMGSYYDVLSPGMESAKPVWIGPQLDQLTGVGLVMTVTYPCYDRSESPPVLIGVVGVDVPMDQLEALSKNFVAHPSYAFIVNNAGEAIVHPDLPQGIQYRAEPHFFDIAELEGLAGNAEFDRIRKDMVHGISGTYTLNKSTQLARGIHLYEGVRTWNSTVSYYYKRFHGDLSVAIAWTTILNDKDLDLAPPTLRKQVTYVRPDSYHLSRVNSNTSFSVAAKGYCDPVSFIETPEDDAFSQRVVAAVNVSPNYTCPTELLRSEARIAIQASSHIGRIWNSTNPFDDEMTDPVKVRFIATHHSGVMRTFPGHTLITKYDPTGVDWYRRALSVESDRLAISVPQTHSDKYDVLSSFEEGKFNTVVFSRVVPYASTNDVSIYGVMGMSVDYTSISELFLESMGSKCTYNPIPQSRPTGARCMWVDSNGYIITHRRFLNSLPPPNSSYIFIGTEEPLLADTFLEHGIMAPEVSSDYSTGAKVKVTTFAFTKNAFKTHAPSGIVYAAGNLIPSDCSQRGGYFVSRVGRTNTFLIVLNMTVNGVCAYYSPPVVQFQPQDIPICNAEIPYTAAATCSVRPITFEEMESIRGIQNCRSETSAIILGILIPLGGGFALLCFIWLYRRYKRMHRDTGMLVGNADIGNPDPRDPNQENPNQMEAGLENVPSYVVDPHVNHESVVILENNNGHSNSSSPRSSRNSFNNNATTIMNNSNNVGNRLSNSTGGLRNQLSHRRPGYSSVSPPASPTASPTSASQPSLRSSTIFSNDNPYIHNNNNTNFNNTTTTTTTTAATAPPPLSPTLSNSNPYTNNVYYEGGDDDMEGGRGIAMRALSPSVVYHSPPSTHNSGEESNSDGEDHHVERESEDEEEEDESDGEDNSGSEGERGDPDDLFAGMAREMGIALPRTSGR